MDGAKRSYANFARAAREIDPDFAWGERAGFALLAFRLQRCFLPPVRAKIANGALGQDPWPCFVAT